MPLPPGFVHARRASDFYESPAERAKALETGKVPLGVGANTTIQRAIVDKNARIRRNVRIVNKDGVREASRETSAS